ncbi:ABC transporter ATP-binding protein [Treponema bryantii]|uniref:ABC transporter ATP-binding protein n=1 Tax=Treponema bryantii TaxID=163 RepID=UPI002B2B5521|nr:multidrug ABC transporter ATP-binding protein [Treponema bryantii]
MLKQIRRIIKLADKYKGKIRIAYLFSFLNSYFTYFPYMLSLFVIKALFEKTMNYKTVAVISGILIFCLLGQVLFRYLSDRFQSTAGYELFADLRMKLGDRLKKIPMGFFSDGNIGKISTILSIDMQFIESNCMNMIADFAGDFCSQIMTVSFMFILHPYLGVVSLVITALIVLTGNLCMKHEQSEADKKQELNEELSEQVLEYIEGMSVIKSYNMLESESNELDKSFVHMKDECLELEKKVTPGLRMIESLNILGITIITGLGIYLYKIGSIDLYRTLGISIFSFGIFRPVREMYLQVTRIAVMNSSLNRMEELFNLELLDETDIEKIPDNCSAGIPEIEYKNVSFSYEEEAVLKNISLEVPPKTMAALTGPSGGGKSTIANLLTRFWDIKEGEILIRGCDIRKVPLNNLMDNISVVFQRVYLFKDTIFNNVRMGKPSATREEVLECLKKARCMDFINKLPFGIDTVIGEGGASLSGGEAQRISIARCILKDSPIIILDEATASVDADNEAYIQQAIDELCAGKTLLVIAHRLNTIKNANAVYKIENGNLSKIR